MTNYGGWSGRSHRLWAKKTRQCRDQGCNYLDLDLNKAEWSGEEDTLLVRKYFELGAKWVQVTKFF
jgi:hypothetical protein